MNLCRKVNGVEQVSGVTTNDFSNNVTYTVTAADNSTQAYLVTVTEAAATDKSIYQLDIAGRFAGS